jgi:hypothetical protein
MQNDSSGGSASAGAQRRVVVAFCYRPEHLDMGDARFRRFGWLTRMLWRLESWYGRSTGMQFAHCEVCFDGAAAPGAVVAYAVEASTGVRALERHFTNSRYEFVHFDVPANAADAAEQFCRGHVGDAHDTAGPMWSVLGPSGALAWDDKAAAAAPQRWFCTEFVTTALRIMGFVPHLTPNATTTQELYEHVAAHNARADPQSRRRRSPAPRAPAPGRQTTTAPRPKR